MAVVTGTGVASGLLLFLQLLEYIGGGIVDGNKALMGAVHEMAALTVLSFPRSLHSLFVSFFAAAPAIPSGMSTHSRNFRRMALRTRKEMMTPLSI